MKILLCTHRFLPRFMGGVEFYTLHLATALQKLGHEIYILTGEPVTRNDQSIDLSDEIYAGLPVIRLHYDYLRRPATYRAAYSDPAITVQIKTILQRLKPDLIHATSLSLLMAGIMEAASELELPLIYTATDFVLTCRRGTYFKRDNTVCVEKEAAGLCTACMGPQTRLERLLSKAWQISPKSLAQPALPLVEKIVSKRADFVYAAESIAYRLNYLSRWRQQLNRIIAPSIYMRDMLVLNGFPPEQIKVSPYGVIPPSPDFVKIPSSQLRFAFIGRITPIKGVHLLLEAFSRLPHLEQVRLTIYGNPEVKSEGYMQNLQQKSSSCPQIRFVGAVDNAQITQLYREIDLLVAPSLWPENSPITILEAQAHGVPVIASDVKGSADLIQHGHNGLIFHSGHVDDLMAQMAYCLESPQLVTHLVKNSRMVKSIQTDAEDIAELYQEILATTSL